MFCGTVVLLDLLIGSPLHRAFLDLMLRVQLIPGYHLYPVEARILEIATRRRWEEERKTDRVFIRNLRRRTFLSG
ncbi:hypothetical protein PspLS_05311 [Pyricularia sp. CBS 133598]|nr:hypothetical protein PspLS_05311 [Pyricularia sp. CBS 133598]